MFMYILSEIYFLKLDNNFFLYFLADQETLEYEEMNGGGMGGMDMGGQNMEMISSMMNMMKNMISMSGECEFLLALNLLYILRLLVSVLFG